LLPRREDVDILLRVLHKELGEEQVYGSVSVGRIRALREFRR